MPPGIKKYIVDISNESSIARACEKVKKELGLISVLVNTAAAFIFKGVEATKEDWDKITSVISPVPRCSPNMPLRK